MHIILGLGNPGKEYDGTRHNVGAEVLRDVAGGDTLWSDQKKLFARTAREKFPAEEVILAIPTTYMNESGKAAAALLSYYKMKPENLLVVHDDIDLPLGTIRISKNASAGGNRGVASIIEALGTKAFARVRIGVAGSTRARTDAAQYVLKPFLKAERTLLPDIQSRARSALRDILTHDIAYAMNQYNKRRE